MAALGQATTPVAMHHEEWQVPLFPEMDDLPGAQAMACCWCLLARAREGVIHSINPDGHQRYRAVTESPCSHYTAIRRAYGIEGSCILDSVQIGLCAACATTRVLREVRKRGPASPDDVAAAKQRNLEAEEHAGWSRPLRMACCFSVTNALLALCFPSGAAAMARADVDGTHGAVCEGIMYNLCCFLPCSHRTFVRKKYGIPGSIHDDVCATTLCPHLVGMQLMTETELRMMDDHAVVQGVVSATVAAVNSAPIPIADMSRDAGYSTGRLPPRSTWPAVAPGVTPRILKERLAGMDLRLLEATFSAMDRLKKGWITSAEMVHLLTDFVDHPFTEGEAYRLVDYIDFDGDGRVEYRELMRALAELTHFQQALAPSAFADVGRPQRGRRTSLVEVFKANRAAKGRRTPMA
jgi:Cys-rich protein (TIGR01571 family)